jgi:hypothetical protein
MKIENLVQTPQLVEVVLDDESLVETYGEPITFHTYDIVSMSVYFDFFNARSKSEFEMLTKLIKSMILDSKGNPVLTEEKDLPIDIVTAAVIKLGDILGKSQGKKSTQKTGKVQS